MSKILKGVYSAAVAVLGSLATVLGDDVTWSEIRPGQWVTIALAGLVAFGGTFGLAGWAGPKMNGHDGSSGG